ncbi:hypothetical protein DCE93_03230 [Agromyces badenianii]|uniref:Uncharacterized protein n=1 Tax=Agromyces badenianii TaxID=2080742 RepID=A0A2S0WU19_9MICO|nr:hypothetical protein [Agromyces badenianii]AWB94791.1 hypothetical protein DCE93_03230 [Agromyces badenianii]PWC03412.1 hypothetical protein DCE94_10180 [Agromyces badenianii]
MSSVLDDPAHDASAQRMHGLPPIGLWWPMLERPLQMEVMENVDAPLRAVVVRRIFELCELDPGHGPRLGVRLGENERAYIAGWMHSVDWH